MPNLELTTIEKEAIKDEQVAYFNEVKEQVNINGKMEDVKRLEYKQIIPAKEGDHRVDVYDGPLGKGYVVVETKVEDGKTFEKATNFGPEEWRTHDWELTSASIS